MIVAVSRRNVDLDPRHPSLLRSSQWRNKRRRRREIAANDRKNITSGGCDVAACADTCTYVRTCFRVRWHSRCNYAFAGDATRLNAPIARALLHRCSPFATVLRTMSESRLTRGGSFFSFSLNGRSLENFAFVICDRFSSIFTTFFSSIAQLTETCHLPMLDTEESLTWGVFFFFFFKKLRR